MSECEVIIPALFARKCIIYPPQFERSTSFPDSFQQSEKLPTNQKYDLLIPTVCERKPPHESFQVALPGFEKKSVKSYDCLTLKGFNC